MAMAMASASILHNTLWIIATSCCLALAFSCQQCCGFMVACRGRPSPQRLPFKSQLLLAESSDVIQPKEKWILLVEDEDDLRTAIGKFLAKEGGYHLTGVSDARSAMLVCRGIVRPDSSRTRFKFDSNFNRHPDGLGDDPMDGIGKNITNSTQNFSVPDCMVLDIRLGKMSGLELLKIIRSDSMLEGLPVVLLTAKGKVEDRILGYEVGADAYLPKPFDPDELLSIINGLMKDKFSVSGDPEERVAQNDNANNDIYENLKRELKEIKSLVQELGSPDGEFSVFNNKHVSLNSLHGDLLEMKDNVKQIMGDDLRPSKSTTAFRPFSSPSVFNPEEIDIINLVARGMTTKEIAKEMQCSVSKIDKRLSAMCKKANVNRRTSLVDWWEKSSENKTTKENTLALSGKSTAEEIADPILTVEETDVMDFLEQGMTTEEIVTNTRSSKRKITNILDDLFKIAHVENRTDLVRWWRTRKTDTVKSEVQNT